MMYNTNTDIWLSGAFAVLIVDFLVYPIDTLKTRIQSPTYNQIYKDATTGAINRKLLFRGLYQGVGSVILATLPASGAFFTTYEGLKHTLTTTQQSPLPTPIIHSLSSCVAESVSCFILTPAEVIKQNAQVYTNPNPNLYPNDPKKPPSSTRSKTNITLLTLRKFRHRPLSLWSGYTALLGRNLPFTGLNFPLFEYLRGLGAGYLLRCRKGDEGDGEKGGGGDRDVLGQFGNVQRALITGVSAAIAGTVSSVVTTPVDVVKTRMMLGAGSSTSNDITGSGEKRGERRRWGAWEVGKKVYREEGVKGLFKGGAIRSVWTAVSFGVYLCVYEGGRGFLENRRREREMASS
ncbi:putative mitochondrial carrier protein [Aspergillus vadensis CBS 113365]|uniref:Mitochondrial carrier n=1 Tax=Aspergillus vadensis (strain CBS 113365 / IMI 142717 / IBT 24658) TaxID=1448311 RepID=A0A319AWL5_ASPVC|nr:mitochondrial carrier [Aspergillus vadensis CBS 113365]PYH64746.1 mitochondrial carrier [Aspergillus vadensis CBS 113365]